MAGDSSSARVGLYVDDKGATKTVQSVQGSLAKLGKDAKSSILTGVGLGAGVAAFSVLSNVVSGAVNAIGDFAQAAIDDEVSVTRLNAALRANIPSWDGNTDAIEDTIAASQRLGFTDDETRNSIAFLTAATHDLTQAQQLHATAMDLARFKGISLQQASEALVKVESGRFRLLASLGIELRKGATATEALAAVQAVAAGQAQEFGDTTAGAMLGAQIAMEEAGEEMGRVLAPAIKDLAEFVRDDLAPALEDLGHLFEAQPDQINPITEAIYHLTGGFSGMSAEMQRDEKQSEQFLDALQAVDPALADVGDAGVQAGSDLATGFAEGALEAIETARELPGDLADALRDGRGDWQDALEQLTDDLENETTRAARIAELQGALAGSELAAGLRSSDPVVKNQAIATRNLIIQQLAIEGVYTKGYNVGALWSAGLAGGVLSNVQKVQAQLWQYRQLMIGKSPPPKGPLKDIDEGGFNTGQAWAEGLTKGITGFAMPAIGIPGVDGGGTGGPMTAWPGGSLPAIVLELDGKELVQSTARWSYLMAPAGPSRLPR